MRKATKIFTIIVTVALVTGLTTYVLAHQRGGRGNMTSEQRAERQRQEIERMYAMERPIEALDSVWIEELTWMEVRDAIAAGIEIFTPTECENYFAAAGYDRQ